METLPRQSHVVKFGVFQADLYKTFCRSRMTYLAISRTR